MQQAAGSIPPSVLLIVLDDVGVDKLEFYGLGVDAPPTPNLDELRRIGVMFTNAYANPLCSPTRAALQTGRYAFRTGMGMIDDDDSLPRSEVTIAEALKSALSNTGGRLRCGAFGKWHLGADDYMHPIEQGYDEFVGVMGNLDDHFAWQQVSADTGGYELTDVGSAEGPWDETTFTASAVSRAALRWIAEQSDQFFAYVCFSPPHHPFQVPPLTLLSPGTQLEIHELGYSPGQDLSDTPDEKRAYDWMLEAVDTEIGRLVHGIDPSRLANTTILVIGDNGTPRQIVSVPPFDRTHAKGSVYQLGTRVPLIVSGASVTEPDSTCARLVGAVDVWRTVGDITGRPQTSGGDDSVSFERLIGDPDGPALRKHAFVQRFGPNGPYTPDPRSAPPGIEEHQRGATDGTFKYVRKWLAEPGLVEEQAFDLSVDPQETRNLWPILETLSPEARRAIHELRESMIALSGY